MKPPKDVPDLQLAELLDFRPDLGVIRLHDQRVVILSAAAMGLMKKELIDTFGRDTTRRLMLRFGYADGYHDAVNMRERSKWADPLDGIRAGAVLHSCRASPRGIRTRSPCTSAPACFHSACAAGCSGNRTPISSRTVSAFHSMISIAWAVTAVAATR